jgi:hypothetical protein
LPLGLLGGERHHGLGGGVSREREIRLEMRDIIRGILTRITALNQWVLLERRARDLLRLRSCSPSSVELRFDERKVACKIARPVSLQLKSLGLSDPHLNGSYRVFAIQSGSIEFGSHTRQLACKAVGSITLLFKSVPLPDPLGLTGWNIELDILARATLRRSGNECQETCRD